jgi:hypothetical protein
MSEKRADVEHVGHGKITIVPPRARVGDRVEVSGTGWVDCPIELALEGKRVTPWKVLRGVPVGREFRPDGTGAFVVQLATFDLEAGKHRLIATQHNHVDRRYVTADLELIARPMPDVSSNEEDHDDEGLDPGDVGLAYFRARAFLTPRFRRAGFIPPGTRDEQIRSIRALRTLRDRRKRPPINFDDPGMPMPGVANWTPLGTGPVVVGAGLAFAGRTLCMAFDPTDAQTIYVGTAGGGVWKTTNGGRLWEPKSDFQISLAVGAIAIDPNDHTRVFAGTGEYNDVGAGTYYGNGLLISTTSGDSWSEVSGGVFQRNEISRILFDPTDATSQKMWLSSDGGLFESPDGGMNWSSLLSRTTSDLVVTQPAGPAGTVRLVAAVPSSGLYVATRTSGTWSAFTTIAGAAIPASFGRIALGQSKNHPNTLYALFAEGVGDGFAGLARSDDGGATWSAVTVRLDTAVGSTSSAFPADHHTHSATVLEADVIAAPAAHVYTTSSAGAPAHTHTVSFTAAEIQTLATGGHVSKTTDADATGHSHAFTFKIAGQSWYNLHAGVHPDDPNTVYLGEVAIWKNTAGGGVFSRVTSRHTDNHAFAFDPTDPNIVWSCNDGGVYRSPDGGATWEDRNTGLATLEYRSVSQHPQYDAVVIGGTQDNGTHRYEGSPAWTFVAGGDGGFTAIDQSNPLTMYYEYVGSSFYRSDDAGGSWAAKNSGITGYAEFKAPFELDPSDQSVCYFGGNMLWRSPDHGDTWGAITASLDDITAIAVHPADSTTIYIGTTTGHVYRVQRTGATWNLADVTTTDLTGAALPVGASIGAIAVATDGTVWVTMASVLWTENTGEFTNDHVYRRSPGGTTWDSRSTGLAVANPINAILIDPTTSDRLFCGGDVGVFRTENAGGMWTPWDEGLPNAPVFDLALHGPRRLLRAATHGRSMWERLVDAASAPMVDLYMRDNIVDTGRVTPSQEDVPHPFDPSTLVHHWQSVDIKVDAQEGTPPAFQTSSAVDNYVDFAGKLVHRNPQRGATNRFYVQILNRGVSPATNVMVRGFFADAHLGLPPLPADFWTSGRPFTGSPSGTDWTPVGASRTFSLLEPGQPGIAEWDFSVPGTANDHSCLLAVATCTEDPIDGGGLLDPDLLVRTRKWVTLKNLHVVDVPPGMPMPGGGMMVMGRGPREAALSSLVIHWGSLPHDTRLFLAFEAVDGQPVLANLASLARLGIEVGHVKGDVLPDHRINRCGERLKIDLEHALTLIHHSKAAAIEIPGVRLPSNRSLAIVMNLVVPAHKDRRQRTFQFDVIQRVGKRVIGGSTYQVRVEE